MRGLDDNLLPSFFCDLIYRLAVLVEATEAAGFLLTARAPGDSSDLLPILHIRPDRSGPEVRAKAVAAFQDIARPCVENGKDAVIEVEARASDRPPQNCLVASLSHAGAPYGVMAFIVRCEPAEAERRLRIVQSESEQWPD